MNSKEVIARNSIYYLEKTNTIKPENDVSIRAIKEFCKEQNIIYAIDIEKIKQGYDPDETKELEKYKNNRLNDSMIFQSSLITKFNPILEK